MVGEFSPLVPIPIQIRKIIYENFNDIENRFTNDEIFAIMKKNGDVNPSWIIDDTEKYFQEICDTGLARNIAQNFTTIYFKLFDVVEKLHCNSCGLDVFLGKSEERFCPNPSCKASL